MPEDVEVVLFAHSEANFLGGSIASILRAAAYAEGRGYSVALTAVLYAPTPLTRKVAEGKLDARWRVLELPTACFDRARNAGRLAVRGRLAAFVDGYDMWCESWLYAGIISSGSTLAVWRPEILLTFGNDFHMPNGYSAIFQPLHLSNPAPLLVNDLVPSGFIVPKALLETHSWPCAADGWTWGAMDRWWSCEVAASGYEHRAVKSTFHYRRCPGAHAIDWGTVANLEKKRIGPTRLASMLMPLCTVAGRSGRRSEGDEGNA